MGWLDNLFSTKLGLPIDDLSGENLQLPRNILLLKPRLLTLRWSMAFSVCWTVQEVIGRKWTQFQPSLIAIWRMKTLKFFHYFMWAQLMFYRSLYIEDRRSVSKQLIKNRCKHRIIEYILLIATMKCRRELFSARLESEFSKIKQCQDKLVRCLFCIWWNQEPPQRAPNSFCFRHRKDTSPFILIVVPLYLSERGILLQPAF